MRSVLPSQAREGGSKIAFRLALLRQALQKLGVTLGIFRLNLPHINLTSNPRFGTGWLLG